MQQTSSPGHEEPFAQFRHKAVAWEQLLFLTDDFAGAVTVTRQTL